MLQLKQKLHIFLLLLDPWDVIVSLLFGFFKATSLIVLLLKAGDRVLMQSCYMLLPSHFDSLIKPRLCVSLCFRKPNSWIVLVNLIFHITTLCIRGVFSFLIILSVCQIKPTCLSHFTYFEEEIVINNIQMESLLCLFFLYVSAHSVVKYNYLYKIKA